MPSGQGYTITFDGVVSTDFPELICEKVTRRLVGKDRSVLREVAGREGAWRFGEKRGLRTITIDLAVVADSYPVARRDVIVSIADWVDKEGYKPLIISDHPDVFNQAFLANEVDIDEWRELGTFQLEFLAEPYPYDHNISTETFTLLDGVPQGFNLPDSLPAYPVLEVTGVGGTVDGFQLSTNGVVIAYDGIIEDTEVITISSLSYTVTQGLNTDTNLTGVFDESALITADVSGSFPILLPLQYNELEFIAGPSSTAISVQVDLYWRRRYR